MNTIKKSTALSLWKESLKALNPRLAARRISGAQSFVVGKYGKPSAYLWGCDATFYAPCLGHTQGCTDEATRVLTDG